ncbi:MAG: agmatine deiminase family protein [Myxococcales bacterium]
MEPRLRVPAEWERHDACWLAFPHLREEWPASLAEAQRSIAELCRAIAEVGGETVRLLVKDEAVEDEARNLIGGSDRVEYVRADYGDCWVRDTAPLLGHDASDALGALCFEFNGWGAKYEMPFDAQVSKWLTHYLGARRFECPVVLEGGALDCNGAGTFLTTASCVLNPNRNPGLTRDAFEEALSAKVVMKRLIWLERGLEHDHTDGHVDMIARFVSADSVVCMRPQRDAPNAAILESIRTELQASGLTVVELPAPCAVSAPDGAPLPASYCNFYVANEAVLVPTYGIEQDETALAALASLFSGRDVVGVPARDLLWGGGALHCVTQPQPMAP